MRPVQTIYIWTIVGVAFMHLWAAISIVEWAPGLLTFLASSRIGGEYFWPDFLTKVDMSHVVGLLVICSVLGADVWTLVSGFRTSAREAENSGGHVTLPGQAARHGLGRIGAALGLAILLVAFVFSLTGSTRIELTASVFAFVALGSMFLLLLRFDASSRVLAEIGATRVHLNSAAEHLKKIESYRTPKVTGV
jgi:hypothetical protein